MSTLEDLDDMERDEKEKKEQGNGDDQDPKKPTEGGKDIEMKDSEEKKKEEEDDLIDLDVLQSSTRDIINRRRLLENELKVMKSEFQLLTHEQTAMKEKIKDNMDKIENNR